MHQIPDLVFLYFLTVFWAQLKTNYQSAFLEFFQRPGTLLPVLYRFVYLLCTLCITSHNQTFLLIRTNYYSSYTGTAFFRFFPFLFIFVDLHFGHFILAIFMYLLLSTSILSQILLLIIYFNF